MLCRLSLEIINADAVQLYEGLSIATAKVTDCEMQGVPHHFLGVLPASRCITVTEYRDLIRRKIRSVLARPACGGVVLVGGTTYYIEAVICRNRLAATPVSAPSLPRENADQGFQGSGGEAVDRDRDWSTMGSTVCSKLREAPGCTAVAADAAAASSAAGIGPHQLYRRLKELNPEAAMLVHPNNTRKIMRAIEIAEATAAAAETKGRAQVCVHAIF